MLFSLYKLITVIDLVNFKRVRLFNTMDFLDLDIIIIIIIFLTRCTNSHVNCLYVYYACGLVWLKISSTMEVVRLSSVCVCEYKFVDL